MSSVFPFPIVFVGLVRRIGITDTHHGVELQRGENFTGRVEDPSGTQSMVYMVMALGGVFFGGVYCDTWREHYRKPQYAGQQTLDASLLWGSLFITHFAV